MIDRVIYIGPSLSGSRLKHAQIFIGRLPPVVQELVDQHGWFKNLLVDVHNYAKASAETRKKGTPLFIYYNKAKEV